MIVSLLISAIAVGLLGAVAYFWEHAERHPITERKFTHAMRVTLGFLIAPLTAALLVTAHFNYLRRHVDAALPFGYGIGDVVLAYVFALVLALIFGLPAYLYLRHRVRITARASAIAGGIIGLILTVLVGIPSMGYINIGILAANLLLYMLIGTATGFTFWLIARPDRAIRKIDHSHLHHHHGSHHPAA